MADDSSNYHRRIYPKQKTIAKGFYVVSKNIVPHSTPARNGQKQAELEAIHRRLTLLKANLKFISQELETATIRLNSLDDRTALLTRLSEGER